MFNCTDVVAYKRKYNSTVMGCAFSLVVTNAYASNGTKYNESFFIVLRCLFPVISFLSRWKTARTLHKLHSTQK